MFLSPVDANVKSGARLFEAILFSGTFIWLTFEVFSSDVFLPQLVSENAKTSRTGKITLIILYSGFSIYNKNNIGRMPTSGLGFKIK
jgi:hypothetical protein